MVSNIVHLFAIGESSINLIILVYNCTSLEDVFFHMHEFSNQILVSFLLDQI